jgi:hypothetical protein
MLVDRRVRELDVLQNDPSADLRNLVGRDPM